jgi:pyruvate dehydrogenase E2 component (dihydrolipoamide acetyltransferase)
MIKYLELTAPEQSEFRQAKVISIEVSEGDQVSAGDALFRVKSGNNEIDLPAKLTGKIVEIIVDKGENISLMTPLVLLETVIEKSTATPPRSDLANGNSAQPTQAPAIAENEAQESKQSSSAKDSNDVKTKRNKQQTKQTKKKAKKKKLSSAQANSKSRSTAQSALTDREQAAQQQSLNLGDESDTNTEAATDQTAAQSVSDPHQQRPTEARINMSEVKVTVPDIGIDSAKVIDVLVSVGDQISIDDSIVTLESDKASMDVPSTHDGTVSAIEVSVDDDVSEGDVLIVLSSEGEPSSPEQTAASEDTAEASKDESETQAPANADAESPAASSDNEGSSGGSTVEVAIPDIGGDSAKVIEIFVTEGQTVDVEDPLVTLESDKASMEVPSTAAGTVQSIAVSLDQEVSEGTLLVTLATSGASSDEKASASASAPQTASPAPKQEEKQAQAAPPAQAKSTSTDSAKPQGDSHASPSVRRLARELGADLSKIKGSGRKNRITDDDVKKFVKSVLSGEQKSATKSSTAATGAGIPEVPAVDFSKFGEIDVQPLNRIKKLTAANLHRSWLNVPHVTHNDESNINDLESFRKQLNEEYKKQGKEIKLSPLAFIVKAVVNALQTYPQFNSSLEPGGENLIYKKYFHIGIAVETPNGLVVPVIRDADKKSVAEIASEMGSLAAKARDSKLTMNDMTGACLTISSLGGIGGTNFTPIVNAPEVAILGVSRSKVQPVWNGSEFEPGMTLPLSLSYDHRVIDGAEAARFTRHVAAVLEDVRRLAI